MTPTTTACPRCQKPVAAGTKFCASCGLDISGVWGVDAALGGTVAVEMDPNVDVLGQLLTEATLGDYDIYGELGRGGMAAVYLGLDLALNRKVAIKTMLPELVAREGMVSRFKREAQTSAALSHPHVIQIYTVKETPKLVYFVMKFIEGRSLESVITDKGHAPLEMAQVILSQVGGALAYAHRKGVVHRDIKPANIMIDEDGWAIVTDFGIAKVQEAQNLTATGTAIGTPHYMSPEQFHNKAITGASDQYSLGIVAYEMLSGKKPFDGGTYAEIITQHLFEVPPDIKSVRPDIPDHVAEAIKKMLAKDPADRFPDCEAAAHAIGAPQTKQGGDAVRTQMISIAKSGPQKKVRMSVPMSPIPASKKPAAPAPTAIEPRAAVSGKKPSAQARAAPTMVEEKSSAGAGKWIGVAATVLLVAGGAYYYQSMRPQAQTEPPAVLQPDTSGATAARANTDSIAQAALAKLAQADSVLAAARRRARDDSLARVARRRDSLQQIAQQTPRRQETAPPARNAVDTPNNTKAPSGERVVAELDRPTSTTTVQQAAPPQAPPPAPAPVVPQKGQIRLGSQAAEAFLYVNNSQIGSISSLRYWDVPAGSSIRLSIQKQGCTPWDTTLVVPAGQQITIGRRMPQCP